MSSPLPTFISVDQIVNLKSWPALKSEVWLTAKIDLGGSVCDRLMAAGVAMMPPGGLAAWAGSHFKVALARWLTHRALILIVKVD